MNNYQFPCGQPNAPQYNNNAFRQIQDMFPQPQGSVYAINSLAEIGNVPIGSTGLSVAISFNDQVMYIKSFQNGNPVIMAYRIAPYTKDDTQTAAPLAQASSQSAPSPWEERLERLENAINSLTEQGGKFNGLL